MKNLGRHTLWHLKKKLVAIGYDDQMFSIAKPCGDQKILVAIRWWGSKAFQKHMTCLRSMATEKFWSPWKRPIENPFSVTICNEGYLSVKKQFFASILTYVMDVSRWMSV